MVLTHALFHPSPQCLHATWRLPPTVHRRKISSCIRSKENISNEEDLNVSPGNESTKVPSVAEVKLALGTKVPSVAEVKLALGIDKKASSGPEIKKPWFMDLENFGDEEFENPSLQNLQRLGEWLFSQGETIQDRLLTFLLLLLPIWLLALLVVTGFIHLPFSIPFLEN